MSDSPFIMTHEEKYYFDLRGYLILRNVLSQEEIDACNSAIDRYTDQIVLNKEIGVLSKGAEALVGEGRNELRGMLGWPEPHRTPFRKMLVHPMVVSRLNELCGKSFRLDHGPQLIVTEVGSEGHWLHGSGEPFNPAVAYHQQNGKIYARGVTVAWQLTDVNPGDGGFVIVPGSHKNGEPTPEDLRLMKDDMGVVEHPVMNAGDVLLFCETATHGTLPWKGSSERRSLLYKYAERGACRCVGRYFTPQERHGDWTNELTPEQQALLYGPGMHQDGAEVHIPVVDSDGEKVWLSKEEIRIFA